jgi:hypothetical protein
METMVLATKESLKPHIISWVSALDDEKLLLDLYRLASGEEKLLSIAEQRSYRKGGQLTDGFNIWGEEQDESIDEYRKKIWKNERSIW